MLQGEGLHQQITRRTQLENGELQDRIELLENRPASTSTQTPQQPSEIPFERPPIVNLLRNTDAAHSVDTWHNSTPSGNDQQHECAAIYAHTKDAAIESTGGITAADNTLDITTNDFVAGDVGKRIVVEGAGTGGADLATTIASFTDSNTVELTDPAVTTVTGAVVRWRLQKLGKKNRRVSADQINDTLKASTHSDFTDVGQIQDPKWNKTAGYIELGSTNPIALPFGYYDGTPNSANNTFIAQHPLYPGRTVFCRLLCARVSRYVKLRGRFYLGIWNNKDDALEWVHGNELDLTVTKQGVPATTTTAQYKLIIETDQGYTLASPIETVTDSPDNASFSETVRNTVRWTAFAGTLRAKLYRKLGSGNVFLLETLGSGIGSYVDRNPATRIDTGSTSFPTPSDSVRGIRSYFAFTDAVRDIIPYNGETTVDANGSPVSRPWQTLEVLLSFLSSVNLANVADPILRIGLTEAPSLYMTDGVTASNTTVTSAAGQFVAAHVGKTVTITDLANPSVNTASRTILAVPNVNTITLNAALAWTSTDNTIEILEGAPHGLLVDLTGASFLQGEWAPHFEDLNRPQASAANPNGSTQGPPISTPPSGGTDPGGIGGPPRGRERNPDDIPIFIPSV